MKWPILAGILAAIVSFFTPHPQFAYHAPIVPAPAAAAAAVQLAAAVTSVQAPEGTSSTGSVPAETSASATTTPTSNPSSSQRIIEKVFEYEPLASNGFITQAELTSQLQQLSNALVAKVNAGPAPSQPLPQNVAADGNPDVPYAAVSNISNLSGVTITNANLTATEIPDLSGTYLPLSGGTVNGDLNVTGSFSGGSLSLAVASTSNLVATNATSTTLFATLGNFTTAIANTFNASIANIVGLTATNATTTNLISTNATTTNLAVMGTGYVSGNLGIGTTSPGSKLSINGTGYFTGNVTTGPLLTVGGNLNPYFQNAFSYSISTTLGSNQITLLSSSYCPSSPSQSCAVAIEQAVYSSAFSQPTWVTAVNGNIVTLSSNALSSNASVATQFGYNRWDTNSAILTNTLGANTGYFGAAADGGSNWPNEYLSGSVGPTAASLFVISTSTSLGIFAAARSSDGKSWSPQQLLAVNDATTTKTIWGQYIESHSTNTSTGLTFNGEYSILNQGSVVTNIDPFNSNINGMTENLRLDCGTGAANPLTCSDALHILNNGATYGAGIVIANNTLATSTHTNPPAIALPAGANGYAIDWYTSAGHIGWSLFSDATSTGAGQMELGSNSLNILNSNVGIGTSTPSSKLELFGGGQTTANLTDAGSRSDVLELFTNGGAIGNGGAVAFGNFQSQNAGAIGFAAIKGLLTAGAGNTTGDLAFSTRNSYTDTNLTERMRITAGGNLGIGTTSPGSILSVQGVANWTTATSTFYSTGGVNLAAGCFAIAGNCLSLRV